MGRFPNLRADALLGDSQAAVEDQNAAVQVFGRRFFADQTPIEYLAELLLVFASPKDKAQSDAYTFPRYASVPRHALSYHPRSRLALKLLAFLGGSKLETRHPGHIRAFKAGIEALERRIHPGPNIKHDDAVRLVQGVFSGFVGVAGDRTWTAHTFLPASNSLLAREVLWRHAGTTGAAGHPRMDWDTALSSSESFFNTGAHSFMARGGEVLYLQLTHLFTRHGTDQVRQIFPTDTYRHIVEVGEVATLRDRLEAHLRRVLCETDHAIGPLEKFVANAFSEAGVDGELEARPATLGWVPTETVSEACLFAWEMDNICSAERSGLQKISLLKDLCVLHVMRSLCFQSARIAADGVTEGFVGNYAWIVSPPGEQQDDGIKKLAINAYDEIESLLYRALRVYPDYEHGNITRTAKDSDAWFDKGDAHVLRLFRKVGKQIGVIVPRRGQGMRITLPAHIVRLLVAALVPSRRRIRLDTFYARIFAHYGLAIDQTTIGVALNSSSTQHATTAFGINATWFEEELRRGGYLVPLSDAVALVANPY